jgi:hypothetical protein
MSGRVGAVVFAVVVATAVGLPRRANSAEADTPSSHLDKATTAFALAHYDVAAEEFEKAFEAKPDPAVLFKAAQAHDLAGHKPRALALYQSYLRTYPKASNRAEAQARMEELKRGGATDGRPPVSDQSAAGPATPEAVEPPSSETEAPPQFPAAPAVQIQAEGPGSATAGPTGRHTRARVALTVVFVASLVGAGLSTAAVVLFGVLENKAESDYATATTQAQQDSYAHTGKTYSTLTNVSIAATALLGAAAVGTGITLIFLPREKKPAPVALVPIVGSGLMGGAATFRF